MPKVNIRVRRSAVIAVTVAALAVALSGCAMPDEQLARFMVAPDKYMLYTCDDIAKETQAAAAREQELRQLMAKADVDAPGRLVSAVAYSILFLSHSSALSRCCLAASGFFLSHSLSFSKYAIGSAIGCPGF